jgi:hypothetical protein
MWKPCSEFGARPATSPAIDTPSVDAVNCSSPVTVLPDLPLSVACADAAGDAAGADAGSVLVGAGLAGGGVLRWQAPSARQQISRAGAVTFMSALREKKLKLAPTHFMTAVAECDAVP